MKQRSKLEMPKKFTFGEYLMRDLGQNAIGCTVIRITDQNFLVMFWGVLHIMEPVLSLQWMDKCIARNISQFWMTICGQ